MNKAFIIKALLIYIVALFPTKLFSQTYDLNEIIKLGLKNNFGIKSNQNNLKIQSISKTSSWKTLFLPRLDLGLYATHKKYYESTLNYANMWQDDKYYELQLSQNLFNGFQDWHDYRLKSLNYDNATVLLKEEQEALAFDIHKIYLEYSLTKNKIEIQKSFIANDEKLFKLAKYKYNNGLIAMSDLNRATINSIRLKKNLSQLENNLYEKKIELINKIGKDPSDMNIKTEPLKELKTEVKDFINNINTQSINSAADLYHKQYIEKSRTLRKIIQDKEIVKHQRSIAMKNYFPTINIQGRYAKGEDKEDLYVGVNISLPLFESFDTYFKVKQESINLNEKINEIEKEKFKTLQNFKGLCREIVSDYKSYELTQKQYELFKGIYKTTFNRFKKGIVDMRAVLEDQRELNETEELLLAIGNRILITKLNIEKLTGGMYAL